MSVKKTENTTWPTTIIVKEEKLRYKGSPRVQMKKRKKKLRRAECIEISYVEASKYQGKAWWW